MCPKPKQRVLYVEESDDNNVNAPTYISVNTSDMTQGGVSEKDDTPPSFYEICKQYWTLIDPCPEYQYYECIEGECFEHGLHTKRVPMRRTRAMMCDNVALFNNMNAHMNMNDVMMRVGEAERLLAPGGSRRGGYDWRRSAGPASGPGGPWNRRDVDNRPGWRTPGPWFGRWRPHLMPETLAWPRL